MTVYLVGAGPGDADLLTLRGARLLGDAEVVVRDRLIDESVLGFANPLAEIVNVGAWTRSPSRQRLINELLIDLAAHFETVVRLKGGDPFVFGRGGEEIEALRDALVTWEVVPGVSSAFAGPLAAGIPVTHRGLSRGVIVVSARGAHGEVTDFRSLAHHKFSLVVMMGVKLRGVITEQLREGGLRATTPVAVIERAWTAQQRTTRGTLDHLASFDVAAPATIIIGAVAALDLRSLGARTITRT